MAFSVNMIGDSHLYWLEPTGIAAQGNIRWHTMRGGRFPFLMDRTEWLEWEPEADITVVMIGGNDLDQKDVDVRALANDYIQAFNRLREISKLVIYMKAWPRPGARYGSIAYWTNVNYFEHLIEEHCWMWQWDKTLRFTEQFYARDGVHCTDSRRKKVARFLTAAVLAGMKYLENPVPRRI